MHSPVTDLQAKYKTTIISQKLVHPSCTTVGYGMISTATSVVSVNSLSSTDLLLLQQAYIHSTATNNESYRPIL